MASAIFNALAAERGLDAVARSAGVAALAGRDMAPNARAALEEIGVSAAAHRARQVSREMLENAGLVLTMSPRHIEELESRFGPLPRKVHVLSEYTSGPAGRDGIADPYGYPMTFYRSTVRQLFEHTELLVTRLSAQK